MRTLSLLALFLALSPVLTSGQGKGSLRKFEGTSVRTLPTSRPIPADGAIGGLSVDARGRFYVATFRNKVFRIEEDGMVTLLTRDFRKASGNAIDRNGELIQSEFGQSELYRVHEDGTRTLITDTGLANPVGVAVDGLGAFFVVNFGNDTITRVAPEGVSLFSNDPLLNGPNGITFDESGDMYVANFSDNLLLRVDACGVASVVAAVGTGENNAHVTALGGKLYVSTIWTHEVYEVTKDGHVKVLAGLKVPGTRDGFAPHQATLYHPNGITSDPLRNVVYTNNYIGFMGSPGATISVRAIHLE